MTNVEWLKFGIYAGCKINGVAAVAKPTTLRHMDRAYYLTALVEAPTYGAVQSYDGAAMSGGPLHNIAVYPHGLTQGSLFQLLSAIEYDQVKSDALLNLWGMYRDQSWGITKGDGILRNLKTSQPVAGQLIRDTFTPLDGHVPQAGPQWEIAKRWALAHHQVFADPATYDSQRKFAIGWLLSTQRAIESTFYKGADPTTLEVGKGISIEEDLAMCIYHSFSVNGPAPARDDLVAALSMSARGASLAKTLISKIASTGFGNWENRYIRTREYALKSGLWPVELFTGAGAIFPVK
jgi:hypothetical protein